MRGRPLTNVTIAGYALTVLGSGGCTLVLGIEEPQAAPGDQDDAGGGGDASPADATSLDAPPPIDAAAFVNGTTCAEILLRLPASPDGVYSIDPDEDGPGSPFNVFCDMTFAGGGWTLALAYAHAGGTDPPLEPGRAPESPTSGSSHFSATQLARFPFEQVRFACTTDAHGRVMDFRTADGTAVDYVKGVGDNLTSAWTGGVITPAEHSTHLPEAADTARSCPAAGVCSAQERLTSRPFARLGVYHWSIGDQGAWECDDAPGDAAATTLHQVWIR